MDAENSVHLVTTQFAALLARLDLSEHLCGTVEQRLDCICMYVCMCMYVCLYVRADLLHADSSDAELARHGRISLRDLVHVVRGVFRGHEVHDDLLLGLSSLLKIVINASEYAAYIQYMLYYSDSLACTSSCKKELPRELLT